VREVSELSILGFISMQFMSNSGELLATHRKLQACARGHGLRLQKVYVQDLGPPSAIFDLLGALTESDGLPLVVPTLHHLAVAGNPAEIREHLRYAGHEVFIANKQAERTC
jgi:hypothetical protein